MVIGGVKGARESERGAKMRYQSWGIFVICLMLVSGVTARSVYGQALPEEIIIDKAVYRTDIYEGVSFRHSVHALDFGIACGICHHTWNQEGDFTIRAQAIDIFDAESKWGTFDVTMPKKHQTTKSLSMRLLERFPLLNLLLQRLRI